MPRFLYRQAVVHGDTMSFRGCCRSVHARCGTFLMFLEILPGEEAHCKPLWRPLDDTWCFFLPCRGIFVTSWWVFAATWKRGKNSAHQNAYIETLHGARTVRATPSQHANTVTVGSWL